MFMEKVVRAYKLALNESRRIWPDAPQRLTAAHCTPEHLRQVAGEYKLSDDTDRHLYFSIGGTCIGGKSRPVVEVDLVKEVARHVFDLDE